MGIAKKKGAWRNADEKMESEGRIGGVKEQAGEERPSGEDQKLLENERSIALPGGGRRIGFALG